MRGSPGGTLGSGRGRRGWEGESSPPSGALLLCVLCLPSLSLPPALGPWKGTLGDGLRALLAPGFWLVWAVGERHWQEMGEKGVGGEWLFPGSLPLGPLRVLASVWQAPSQSLWQVLESTPSPHPFGRLESSTGFSTLKWPLYGPYPNHPI